MDIDDVKGNVTLTVIPSLILKFCSRNCTATHKCVLRQMELRNILNSNVVYIHISEVISYILEINSHILYKKHFLFM